MKSYTDLEQSKKLAKILPLESADMIFLHGEDKYADSIRARLTKKQWEKTMMPDINPCWSLAALLDVLPKSLIYTPNPTLDGYCCKNIMYDLETYGDNPIDACVAMIEELHELNLL